MPSPDNVMLSLPLARLLKEMMLLFLYRCLYAIHSWVAASQSGRKLCSKEGFQVLQQNLFHKLTRVSKSVEILCICPFKGYLLTTWCFLSFSHRIFYRMLEKKKKGPTPIAVNKDPPMMPRQAKAFRLFREAIACASTLPSRRFTFFRHLYPASARHNRNNLQ